MRLLRDASERAAYAEEHAGGCPRVSGRFVGRDGGASSGANGAERFDGIFPECGGCACSGGCADSDGVLVGEEPGVRSAQAVPRF